MARGEDVRDRQFGNHLNSYYDEVIAAIRGADSIQIFGPGEAKGELEKRLEHEGLKSTYPCHRNRGQDDRSPDLGKSSGTFFDLNAPVK